MAKKKYKYEKIQPEIMSVLEDKVERIRDRFGVVYVPKFNPKEIQKLIPTEAGISTIRRACQELWLKGKIHGWTTGPYYSVKMMQLKNNFYTGKIITIESHERRQDEQAKKVDKAWNILDIFRRYGLSAVMRRMSLGRNEPFQIVVIFDDAEFDDLEAFLRNRIK